MDGGSGGESAPKSLLPHGGRGRLSGIRLADLFGTQHGSRAVADFHATAQRSLVIDSGAAPMGDIADNRHRHRPAALDFGDSILDFGDRFRGQVFQGQSISGTGYQLRELKCLYAP